MLRLEYPGLPPKEFSRNNRAHWTALHRVQDRINDDMLALLLESGWRQGTPLESARISVQFVLPDRRRRDADNLITACKPLLDSLVTAGVIEDDSIKSIGFPTYGYKYGRKGKAATIIEVRER